MRYEHFAIETEGQKEGKASLHAYLLDAISVAPEKKRPAVIVCAGGGYERKSDRESEPVVLQFLSMGCHGFLMDYSVAPSRFPTAVKELALAVALVREHSQEWHVDPERIFVCGFSAGGHLACSLGVFWNREFLWKSLGKAPEQIRPSGMILGYPVISSGPFAHVGSFKRLLGDDALEGAREGADQPEQERFVSLETQVSPDTPKTFLWHTFADSSVPLENSLMLAEALHRNGVEFEMHIYPKGEHGLSLAAEETAGERREMLVPSVQSWIHLAKTWIEGFGNA